LTDNSNSIPLVLVHIGPIPKYLKSNLKYLKESFPDRRKVLICDRTNDLWLKNIGFELVDSDSLVMDWPQRFMVTDHRQYFRNNFWFTSKARLMLLPKFMKTTGLKHALHLESDVWIHPNFPFHFFDGMKAPLAFPKVDNERGIASTLFINGEEGIDLLEQACDRWSSLTDMEILGNLIISNPRVLELESTNNIERATQNSWLFDGAKLGMYLYGTDPRNSKGIIKRFSRSPLGKLDFGQKVSLSAGQIVMQNRNIELRVASLHIHSKEKAMFGRNWQVVIAKQLKKEQFGASYGFKWAAFWMSISEMFGRGTRKLKSLR